LRSSRPAQAWVTFEHGEGRGSRARRFQYSPFFGTFDAKPVRETAETMALNIGIASPG
jgi:hypothetical protein